MGKGRLNRWQRAELLARRGLQGTNRKGSFSEDLPVPKSCCSQSAHEARAASSALGAGRFALTRLNLRVNWHSFPFRRAARKNDCVADANGQESDERMVVLPTSPICRRRQTGDGKPPWASLRL